MIWNFGLALAATCSWAGEPVSDFHLLDANANSERRSGQVSPRDYLLQVSGYYFGAAG